MREITCPVEPVEEPPPFKGPPTICFVGRFESRKGPDTLVRAMPKVVSEVPDARLVLNGHDTSDVDRPSFARHLRELADELGVSAAVDVNERWGDHRTVQAEMAASTVCVMPSRWESFGYVAAEAAALGRPVVASNIPALAEVVAPGENGLLVEPEDVDGWAEAITRVLRDPGLAARWGQTGRQLMRSERDPETIARQTLAVYEEAIALHRGRGWR
jgi:glycosyltransferase involved in cell wall biosynthesis